MEARRTFIVGVGLTKFDRAGSKRDYPEMTKEAMHMALDSASLSYMRDVKAAVVGYCYGEPTCGQRALYQMGLTGIPVFNTNNNCSTASSALFLARTLIQSGQYDCVLALGFEKMQKNLSQIYTDNGWSTPLRLHYDHLDALGSSPSPLPNMNEFTGNILKMFGDAATEHQHLHGSTDVDIQTIAYKNHRHSINNPYARSQKEYSMEEIANPASRIYGPLTQLQCCPTGDGAACAIVCSENFILKNQLENLAVEILAQEMVTDTADTFNLKNKSYRNLCGTNLAKIAADRIYASTHLSPKDVDVLEVHDCFSINELLMYEALGLCREGDGGKLASNGEWVTNGEGGSLYRIGNRWVVNPSGGLESKGHPIGATGLAQCAELYWQLLGMAKKRQVPNAKIALQHNFGIGSAAVVTMYQRYTQRSKL
eukprot:TRINITY_DN6697_c0_g1_i1.p1 TRINITY_DN6697_c0_g1~~TRINITY_DN6697_c0_g1_i1.p1  ORF type:complete len:436 (-),score=112.05 TRINITY_DN6697_c0_g1_i1:40-1314(-)